MKNKKAQAILFVIILVAATATIICMIYFVVPLFFNSGASTDYPYTVEHTNAGWYKLWLKDDHTSVYCFDDERFISIIDKAKAEGKKVKVSYQDYWFRGFLCTSGSENIGTTVVTNVEVVNG